jgi:hypothetical protein
MRKSRGAIWGTSQSYANSKYLGPSYSFVLQEEVVLVAPTGQISNKVVEYFRGLREQLSNVQ